MSILPILGAGLLCPIAVAVPLSPETAVSMALSVHPQLRAAEADLQRAQAAHTRAAAPLYNPEFSAQAALSQERLGVSLSQPLSLTGGRRLQRQQTGAALDAAQAGLERARFEVAVVARAAYADAVVTATVAALARENVALSAQLENAARLRHEEGEASLLDLRLTRLSSARAASWLLASRSQEVQAIQRLSAVVGQHVEAAELIADPLLAVPPPAQSLTGTRSDILAAQSALSAAEADLRQQRAAVLAPVSVGAFLEQEDGVTFAGPSVSWALPVFQRNQSGRAAASGAIGVAEAELNALSARVESELITTTDRHEEADALLSALGEDLVAEARAALEGIAFSYRAGHTDLLSTLVLQSEVVAGQAALITLRGQLADARLDLLLATEDDALLPGGVR